MRGIHEVFDKYDAIGMAELVRCGEVCPEELVETAIERIERVNPILNCVCIKTYELAKKIAKGPLPEGPFTGVPILMKNLGTFYVGVPTTASCRFLLDFIPDKDSTVVERWKKAGFILIGKTNTPEFGSSISTEPTLYGPTRNPWNTEFVSGGSSGGAASSVSARIIPLADGSDGGGSIRIPASNTGVFGLKPSRGRVPVGPHYGDCWYGNVCFNCLSITVRDSAAFLDAIAGPVPGDPYQVPKPERLFVEEVRIPPKRLRIGLITESPAEDPVDPVCVKAAKNAAELCEKLGHYVEETRFTFSYDEAMKRFNRIVRVLRAMEIEKAEKMLGKKAKREDFEAITWLIYELGKKISGVRHAADIDELRKMGRIIASEMKSFDILLTPTLPVPPQKLGVYVTDGPPEATEKFGNLIHSHMAFTVPFNISGQPAASLPLYWSKEGLPIGVQFAARYGDEATLIRLSAQLEDALPWRNKKPPICA